MVSSPTRRFVVTLVAVAVLVGACGGETNSAVPGDFAEIAIGEAVMTPAPSGLTATLTVATSVEAVCAVAFGETDELGHLATDQDMGGAGHSDHAAVLTGLTPDTEYFYRLQGVTGDGRLFQGDTMRFRTPPASGALDDGNVALGATIVEVSSEFSGAFGAANAVDGDPATEWSSRNDGDDAFITLDLGRVFTITGVAFETRSMSDGTATAETFTVTVDGVTCGPFDVGLEAVDLTGQVIRFDVETSTGGNTGALEIKVFSGS